MSFIKTEKISYAYPVIGEIEGDWAEESKASDGQALENEKALDDITLSLEEGDFICILGGNGSGKSTLARHLNALLVPDEGSVWVDGNNTADEKKIWDIRKCVGMIFQNPDNQIIGSLVDEEVAFGPENLGVDPEDIQKRVDEALFQVGLSEHAKASPNKLSGGQKQRLSVAGVLSMDPKCIVLDESTSMLDPMGRREIMNTVRRLNKEKKLTVICITHFMDEAMDADKVFVMSEGRIKMQGTPDEIFSRPLEIEKYGLKLPARYAFRKRLLDAGVKVD